MALPETTMMQSLMMSTMFVLSSARSVDTGGAPAGVALAWRVKARILAASEV